jgi:hypothetical protein
MYISFDRGRGAFLGLLEGLAVLSFAGFSAFSTVPFDVGAVTVFWLTDVPRLWLCAVVVSLPPLV